MTNFNTINAINADMKQNWKERGRGGWWQRQKILWWAHELRHGKAVCWHSIWPHKSKRIL